ncbi:hypothetical protein MKX01_026599 [Papaver californicum]|nr:hypothetical protein MKX01_026599 [Papaver californicum]
MASQIIDKNQKVLSSTSQGIHKSFRSMNETRSTLLIVHVTKKREELNFICTNDVTNVDMVIVDKEGEEMHALIPNNLILEFDEKIQEGRLYSGSCTFPLQSFV